jgi:hypothetical protein
MTAPKASQPKDFPALFAGRFPAPSNPPPRDVLPQPADNNLPKQEQHQTTAIQAPKSPPSVELPSAPKRAAPKVEVPASTWHAEDPASSSTIRDARGPQTPPEPVLLPGPTSLQPAASDAKPPDVTLPRTSDTKAGTPTNDAPPAGGTAATPPAKQESKTLPPPTPIEDLHAADVRKIRVALERYATAYRTADIDKIKAARTRMPTSDLESITHALSKTGPADYRLEPRSDPQIDGDTAVVPCLLTHAIASTALQRQSTKSDEVTVHLARIAGDWKVSSVQFK